MNREVNRMSNITLYNLYIISSFGIYQATLMFIRSRHVFDLFVGYIVGIVIGSVITFFGESILNGYLGSPHKMSSAIIAWVSPVFYLVIIGLWLAYISLGS